jgi:hypothetical protein
MMNPVDAISRKLLLAALSACLLISSTSTALWSAPLSCTPDPAHNSVSLEGLIPAKQFMGINLPKGSIEFVDGTVAVNIVPNWNFDRVAVLQGPIIRMTVTATDKQATVSGIVLFTQGYWYDKYWTPGSQETVVTASGTSVIGKIVDMTTTTLTVVPAGGAAQTVIALADVKEVQSPRAYSFNVPAAAAMTIPSAASWTADAQNVAFSPTAGGSHTTTSVALARRDPLLVTNDRADGDWSNKKMWVIGTLLSLAQLGQFAPTLVTALESHSTWQTINRKAFFFNQQTLSPNAAPLINGNTYSIPGMATH